ncbi:MAG: type II toxin-antitoxin system RelE/ParE family toxin [Flavobacteriales bacterium]|nr:MAG: type II toxin-antitoxin system RelE/ParE family toxin [Flavobacteriales bacterium]
MTYLETEWGTAVADAFVAEVEQTVSLLENFPHMGVVEVKDKGIRSIPVARQVRLFHRIQDDTIIVLEFMDTRTEWFQNIRK